MSTSTSTAASVLAACAAGSACALIASGGAALSMRAGLGQHASALWMSALALAAMMGVPLLMARPASRHTTLASAATLIVTMSAMNALPAYLNGMQQGGVVAALMIAAGGMLLYYWRHVCASAANTRRHADMPIEATRPVGAAALLALFAGLSSGTLARFQLYALCGSNGAQPCWQIALSLIAVCALALLVDRSRNNNSMLTTLYIARAALIGALATLDDPALAPLAAKFFLLLDCVTIPALATLRGSSQRVLSASCPGIAHHLGMVTGAALSTTPYFFNDGFVVLFALSAAANLICAASLATHWRARKTPHPVAQIYHRFHRPAHSSS
ncbi:hypothetical protein FVF58_13350 [Paraburkholderia panacisoli]|uniref:MFS transporter n=1 Tax=Paraburkholderia panacisoli TaxID=2603818 RepID=A0A5B0HA45_9BURK|nr:hypothetical protein [Paraburkholderia panacisoli]KAA1012089.1 hypothetical protein FVF58_13350 [Paraburkholderia panacisoli]